MKKTVIILAILVAVMAIVDGVAFYIYNMPENRVNRSMNLAQKYLAEGNWEEAVVQLNKVIEIDDTNLDAYVMLADVYKKHDDFEEAVKVYNRIIELEPTRIETYEDLINAYMDLEDFDKVIDTYKALINIDPDNPKTYLRLADIYINSKKWEEAQTILEKGFERTGDEQIEKKLEEVKEKLLLLDEYSKLRHCIYGKWENPDPGCVAEIFEISIDAPNEIDIRLEGRFYYRGTFELVDNTIDCKLQGYESHDPADPYNLEFDGEVLVHLRFDKNYIIFEYEIGDFKSDTFKLDKIEKYDSVIGTKEGPIPKKSLKNPEITEDFLKNYIKQVADVTEKYTGHKVYERIDYDDYIEAPLFDSDRWPYYRVKDKNFTGKKYVQEVFNNYYLPNVTNAILEDKNWIEKDGKLYESVPGDYGLLLDYILLDVICTSEDHIFIQVSYHWDRNDITYHNMNINLVDGKWLSDTYINEDLVSYDSDVIRYRF